MQAVTECNSFFRFERCRYVLNCIIIVLLLKSEKEAADKEAALGK